MMCDLLSSVGSVQDLRAGDSWFDPWLGQYSFRGFMILIVTGFIPLLPLSTVSTLFQWLCGKAASGLERIFGSTGLKNSRRSWIGTLDAMI